MEYSYISICRASTCKSPTDTQRDVSQQVERVYLFCCSKKHSKSQKNFESLVNIVGPVIQAMRLKCQSADPNFKFDKASQIESEPTEVLTLVNLILEGITCIIPGNDA